MHLRDKNWNRSFVRATEFGWSIEKMEEPLNWNSIPQCRLCGRFGPHKIDIFGNNAYHLVDKIFKCTGIRVNISAHRLPSNSTRKLTRDVIDILISGGKM